MCGAVALRCCDAATLKHVWVKPRSIWFWRKRNVRDAALVFPRVGCSARRRAAPLWRPSLCERLLTKMICCQMWLQMSRCCSAAARLVATARCCCLGDQNSEQQFYTRKVLTGTIWTHPLMGRATFLRECVHACARVCVCVKLLIG